MNLAGEDANAFTWHLGPVDPGRCVVVDLDGVLSDASARQHYVNGTRKDWDGFFAAAHDDPLIDATKALLDELDASLQVVLLTARPTTVHELTERWLARHEIRWDLLVMRPAFDRRRSNAFKYDALQALLHAGFEPVLAFEDDPKNVEMLRSLDIPTVYVHSGYYD